jgi:hypothetical protein
MKTRFQTLGILGAVLLSAAASVQAQVGGQRPEPGNKPIETFDARAFNVQRGQTSPIEIVINRWSTDGEREVLKAVLKAAGSQAMVQEMEKMPQVGYIKTPESMGDALMFARSTELPDGTRQVVVATNRPISVAGSLAPGTAQKYDLSVIEMRWKKGDKKGEGKMTLAAQASIDPKTGNVQIQNYAGMPSVLKDITAKTSS